MTKVLRTQVPCIRTARIFFGGATRRIICVNDANYPSWSSTEKKTRPSLWDPYIKHTGAHDLRQTCTPICPVLKGGAARLVYCDKVGWSGSRRRVSWSGRQTSDCAGVLITPPSRDHLLSPCGLPGGPGATPVGYTAVQSQKAVTAYSSSKQLMPFDFA